VDKPFKINVGKQGICMKKTKPSSFNKAFHLTEFLHSLNVFLTLI
jgi:hypothetical protein